MSRAPDPSARACAANTRREDLDDDVAPWAPPPAAAAPDEPGAAPVRTRTQDDRALVGLVCSGDAAALEALYGRYGRACYGLARRILTDEQLAQDVVQEVFLAVWRDAGRFDATRGGFSTWLLSMTHHKAVDSVRREENLRKRRTSADVLEHDGVRGAEGRRRGLVARAARAGPRGAQDACPIRSARR